MPSHRHTQETNVLCRHHKDHLPHPSIGSIQALDSEKHLFAKLTDQLLTELGSGIAHAHPRQTSHANAAIASVMASAVPTPRQRREGAG